MPESATDAPVTLDSLQGLVDTPEFAQLPFEDRQKVVENGLDEAWGSFATTNWGPEAPPELQAQAQGTWLYFGAAADDLRAQVEGAKTEGEKWHDVGRELLEPVKGLAKMALGFGYDVSPIGGKVTAPKFKVPLATTVEGAVHQLDKGVATLDSAVRASGQKAALENAIDRFGAELHNGDFFKEPSLEQYYDRKADEIGRASLAYNKATGLDEHTASSWALANNIHSPRNAAMLSQYMRTRNPKDWETFKKSLLENYRHAHAEGLRQKMLKDTPWVQSLNRVMPGLGDEAASAVGDPVQIAAMLLPMLRGANAVKGAAGSQLARGTAEAQAMGQAGLAINDPDATWQQHMDTAKTMFILSTGMHGVGAGLTAVAEKVKARGEPMPETPTAGAPDEISASESAATGPAVMSGGGTTATAPGDAATVPPPVAGSSPAAGATHSTEASLPPGGTGIRNSIVDAERAARGLPPREAVLARTFETVWVQALTDLARDPERGARLVEELRHRPRPLTDLEDAILTHEQMIRQQEFDNAVEAVNTAADDVARADAELRLAAARDKVYKIYEVGQQSGTANARGLNARRLMIRDDFSLANMEAQRRAGLGGRGLTLKEQEEVKAAHEKIAAAARKVEEHEEKQQLPEVYSAVQQMVEDIKRASADLEKQRAEDVLEQAAAEARRRQSGAPAESPPAAAPNETAPATETPAQPAASPDSPTGKVMTFLDEQIAEAKARLRDKGGYLMVGMDPTTLLDHAIIAASYIAKGIVKTADLGAKLIREFGESIRPHVSDIIGKARELHRYSMVAFQAAKRDLKAAETPDAVKASALNVIRSATNTGGKAPSVATVAREIAKAHLKAGTAPTLQEFVAAVHADMESIFPGITAREVRDAISGYGKVKKPTKDEILKQLKEMQEQARLVSAYEDASSGNPPLKTGQQRAKRSDEVRRLRQQLNEVLRKNQVTVTDEARQMASVLTSLKTRLRNGIKDLNRRISTGDFSKPKKREIVLDNEAVRLKADYERAKLTYRRIIEEDRLKNRTYAGKVGDALVKWSRFVKISGITVIGKLFQAAQLRFLTTPLENLTGAALAMAPGISKIASKAARERGFSWKAEFAEAWVKGWKGVFQNAGQVLKTGKSDIEALHGKPEYHDLDSSILDYMGHLHMLLKLPAQQSEYFRSLQYRVEAALEDNPKLDVNEPVVAMRLSNEAFKDSLRAKLMQDNVLTSRYQMIVRSFEGSKEYPFAGPGVARVARFLLPIVKIPTNYAFEASNYIFGVPRAAFETVLALKRGFDKLTPEEADAVMRHWKKGSFGMGLILLGFFNRNNIGGYYQDGERRQPGEVKAGGFRFFGWDVPRWLSHTPALEALHFGATIGRVMEHISTKTGEHGTLTNGILAGTAGLLKEVPFFEVSERTLKAMHGDEKAQYLRGSLVKGALIPQGVSQISEWTDPYKRSARSIPDYIKSGIPGLRETLPAK